MFGQCQSLARRCVQSRVPRPWVAAAPRASVGNQRPLRTAELRGRDVGCVACVSEPAVAPVGVVGLRPPTSAAHTSLGSLCGRLCSLVRKCQNLTRRNI